MISLSLLTTYSIFRISFPLNFTAASVLRIRQDISDDAAMCFVRRLSGPYYLPNMMFWGYSDYQKGGYSSRYLASEILNYVDYNPVYRELENGELSERFTLKQEELFTTLGILANNFLMLLAAWLMHRKRRAENSSEVFPIRWFKYLTFFLLGSGIMILSSWSNAGLVVMIAAFVFVEAISQPNFRNLLRRGIGLAGVLCFTLLFWRLLADTCVFGYGIRKPAHDGLQAITVHVDEYSTDANGHRFYEREYKYALNTEDEMNAFMKLHTDMMKDSTPSSVLINSFGSGDCFDVYEREVQEVSFTDVTYWYGEKKGKMYKLYCKDSIQQEFLDFFADKEQFPVPLHN